MSIEHACANILHTVQALKDEVPPNEWSETPLPVIAAPSWWIAEALAVAGANDGKIETIHECPVIQNDDIAEPVLVAHDGRTFPVLPAWLRAKERK